MTTSRLFDPARLGALTLPNRLVMAPMTRNRASADGVPQPVMATYYAQRATAGLIIAEASTPNAVGQTYANITAIHSAAHVEGWRHVTDEVRAAGGRMFLQLQHGGRIGHPDNSGGLTPIAPSPVPLPDTIHTATGHRPAVIPREMTSDDIRTTVADFADAARKAVAAGFEGVEVHGANGYLLHQFLGRGTNHRTDAYGGTVEGRVRFVAEVVRAVADAIGPERVGLRISPGLTVNGMDEGDTDDIYSRARRRPLGPGPRLSAHRLRRPGQSALPGPPQALDRHADRQPRAAEGADSRRRRQKRGRASPGRRRRPGGARPPVPGQPRPGRAAASGRAAQPGQGPVPDVRRRGDGLHGLSVPVRQPPMK